MCVRLHSSTFTDMSPTADFFGQTYNKFIHSLYIFYQRRWNFDKEDTVIDWISLGSWKMKVGWELKEEGLHTVLV